MGGYISRWKTSYTQPPPVEEVKEEDPVLTRSLAKERSSTMNNEGEGLDKKPKNWDTTEIMRLNVNPLQLFGAVLREIKSNGNRAELTYQTPLGVGAGFAWVTLATNDSYSLGALVLAHSLKNVNTAHRLAVLITPSVSPSMREQLSTVFDVVKVVDVLDSKDEAHLALIKRPELGITFTKIHCWRLTEFDKCVFLDADTLVIRNCDELFDREELSAAPDVGWPDCFNTGVFVYKPSIETFNNLIQFSLQHGSFDGGDQGLLNQFFSDWATKDIEKHLPFVYNLTSVAVYSYIPAFKQYGSQIRIVHFIGTAKPWLQQMDVSTRAINPAPGSEHLTPMLQIWWDIFCEKVHPSLAKNLDCGSNNDEIEACSNDVPVERETAELTVPFTPYIEKDDSRQFNLPYHPFDVKSSSGELLNVTYCEKLEQEMLEERKEEHYKNEEQQEQEPQREEPQPEPKEDVRQEVPSEDGKWINTEVDSNVHVPEMPYEEEPPTAEVPPEEPHFEEPATEDKQSPFTYETFFPDETCVQNYLEHNVMTYQPFDNPYQKPVVELEQEQTLPRFLTIAEDDQRQSLNVCHEDPQPQPQFQPPSPPPPPPETVHHPPEKHEERSITRSMSQENLSNQCDTGELWKWKSMPNLEARPDPMETEEEVSFWHSHPHLRVDPNKKFPMPKLKPLKPKQGASPDFHISAAGQKITQYTEFQMSSDYRDTVPMQNIGFVEKHILEEVSQKEMDVETRLRTLSYIFPQQHPNDIAECNLRRTYNNCFDDMTHYDLSTCQRQKGNQPLKNVSKSKSNSCFLPVLKPLRPETGDEPRRKLRSNGRPFRERGTKAKMESRKAREKTKADVCIKPSIQPSNVEDILKRLINFSKDYQNYFSEFTTESETVPAKAPNVFKNVYAAPVKESPRLQYCKQFEERVESPFAGISPMVNGTFSPVNQTRLTNGGLDWSAKDYNGVDDQVPMKITQHLYNGIGRSTVGTPDVTTNGSGELPEVEERITCKITTVTEESRTLINGNAPEEVEGVEPDDRTEETNISTHIQTHDNEKDRGMILPVSNGSDVTEEKGASGTVLPNRNEEPKEKESVLPEKSDAGRDNKIEQETILLNGREASTSERALPTYASVVKNGERTVQSDSVESVPPPRKRNKRGRRTKRKSAAKDKPDTAMASEERQRSPEEKKPSKPLPRESPDETTTKNSVSRPSPRAHSARTNHPVNKASEVNQKSKSAASTDASAIDKSGIAGAIAKLSLQPGGLPGTQGEATSSAQEDYIRRQNWEMGTMDYMGRDSFDNIWAKICETIDGKAPTDLNTGGESSKTQPEAPPSSEGGSAVPEKPVPEESKPTEAPEKMVVKDKSEVEPQSVASEIGTGLTGSDSPPKTVPEPKPDLPAKAVQALEAFGKLFVSGPVAIKSDVSEEAPKAQPETGGDVPPAEAPASDQPQPAEQERKKSTELSDEESKQKKGMLNKILELVGVSKPETAQSVFYDTEEAAKGTGKEGLSQSVFYDVEVGEPAEEKKDQGLKPEEQKPAVSEAAPKEGSSDVKTPPSPLSMKPAPDAEGACPTPPPTPQADVGSGAVQVTPQTPEGAPKESGTEGLKAQVENIIDEAKKCVEKELEKLVPKTEPETKTQPKPSQSMALVPALEAFGKLFVSGPVCIKSEIPEETPKPPEPKPDEASKPAEQPEASKAVTGESVPVAPKPAEVPPTGDSVQETKPPVTSATEGTVKAEDATKPAEPLPPAEKAPEAVKPAETSPLGEKIPEAAKPAETSPPAEKVPEAPKPAEAPSTEQMAKTPDVPSAEGKPAETKEASQEVPKSSDKEPVQQTSSEKQPEPSEISKITTDAQQKIESAAASLMSKASEALEVFGKVFVSGPVILKSEVPDEDKKPDTDKPVAESGPQKEKTEEIPAAEKQAESLPAAPTEEKKQEAAPAAAPEEKKPEPAVAPVTEEKKPESTPATTPEAKKPEATPAAAPEEKKPESTPAAVTEEKKPEPTPATAPEATPAAGAEEKKVEPAPASGAEEKKAEPTAADKAPQTKPAVEESPKSMEALEAFGKMFVSGPVVLKSEVPEDKPQTPQPEQMDAPDAVHRILQSKPEEPIYCNIEEVEEIKVTSEEDRKKDKPMSSKLSEQILKAIPAEERKPFTDAAAAAAEVSPELPSTIPQNVSILTDRPISEDAPPSEAGASAPVPPVPPRRNRSKGRDAPQPPPKKKGKNGQS